MTDLTPITPTEAVSMYVTERADDVAEETLRTHKSDLQHLIQWCNENDIDNLNNLSGRHLHQFRLFRKKSGIATTTLKSQLSTIRVFFRHAATIEAVPENLPEKVLIPKADNAERHEMIGIDTVERILQYLQKYDYASRDHALFQLMWKTGIRTGTARSFDTDNYDSSEQYIEAVHRPEQDTPLKNGNEGERHIALSGETCLILDDYLQMNRLEDEDEYGRTPLFTTRNGRIGTETIRRTMYRLTRPCHYGEDCPHDTSPSDCKAAHIAHSASQCPSSMSGHPLRRASITHFLKNDVPETVVSDRMNVSKEVLDKHYDERTSKEKMNQRRSYLSNV